ncbi:RNA polymerase-binding protein RbpA [Saccharopolyspora hattusasensis]|uniref:RNA polymerase-binding protein RbpA n=1 Tax=Saccharopolyspora hattusasensis TaxID=1128679 RepID=UPI003D98E398
MEARIFGRALPRMRPNYQSPEDYEPAAKVIEAYVCPRGEAFTVTFAADGAVPETWECRQHALWAVRSNLAGTDAAPTGLDCPGVGRAPQGAQSRTHFERVLERRSLAELQQLLDERLDALAAARCQP